MTTAQHNAFTTFTATGGSDSITLSDAATITADSAVETYVLADATNEVTAHANTTHLTGGSGADTFIMGANMDSGVTIDGGVGVDEITMTDAGTTTDLDNVTNVETITLGAAATSITSVDALVASSATLTVNGSGIGGNEFIFDGSAETDGKFVFTGSAGDTVLTGGSGDDIFNLASDNFDASDSFDGTSGADTVNITGNTVIVDADIDDATFANIDAVTFANTNTDITWTIADGEVDNDMSITASSTTSGVVTIDGAAESSALTITTGAGADIITGGAGADVINTGGGNDIITGGAGADIITGGAGANDIVYTAITDGGASFDLSASLDGDITESTSNTAGIGDYIIGFASASDQILINGDLEGALEAAGAATVVTTAGIDYDAVGIAIVDNSLVTVADFGDLGVVSAAIDTALAGSTHATDGDEFIITLANTDNTEHGIYYFKDADATGDLGSDVGDSLSLLSIVQYSGDLTTADIIA